MNDADQVARDTANKAIGLIEGHERVCTERQLHIIEQLQDLKRGVEGLYRRFWAAALAIIGLLIAGGGEVAYLYLLHH